jgi:hypothetical protein
MIAAGFKKHIVWLGIVGAILVAIGGYLLLAPRRVPRGQDSLVYLDAGNIGALRREFNSGVGGTRLLVLLSPT